QFSGWTWLLEHTEAHRHTLLDIGPYMMPTSQYIEPRNGGYYIAGTRIGLDLVVYDFREGRSPEEIIQSYPSIGSLAKLYGAITFVLEHPKEIDAYLAEQERAFEEFKASHPLPPEMLEPFIRARKEKGLKSA